ncbi:hypothetical protein NEISUBOT_04949 [Neisseria subflava NJ9703]|uniref:Uncharacterized protein n=1 Tax=Neisseria subflava NJ9703 TaxID=546268 RepID=A0A9W5MZ03_NEISU|nr:hypothetical protein NEISUBOT_04949 [Neisseria subflava NJ9703]
MNWHCQYPARFIKCTYILESTHTNNNDREHHTKEPFRFLNKNTF